MTPIENIQRGIGTLAQKALSSTEVIIGDQVIDTSKGHYFIEDIWDTDRVKVPDGKGGLITYSEHVKREQEAVYGTHPYIRTHGVITKHVTGIADSVPPEDKK